MQIDSKKHDTPTDANNVLADGAFPKDLIYRDISRCNDYKCPTRGFCARFRQMAIDRQKGETIISVNDFNGREKVGLCDYFINADVD